MPLVVKNLIIINALFYLARYTFISLFGFDLNDSLGLYYYKSPEFNPWQIISYMFMHGGFMHIIGNMLYMWIFADNIEDDLGSTKFVIL